MSDNVKMLTERDLAEKARRLGVRLERKSGNAWTLDGAFWARDLAAAFTGLNAIEAHVSSTGPPLIPAYPSTCTGEALQERLLEDLLDLSKRLTPESRVRLIEGLRRMDG